MAAALRILTAASILALLLGAASAFDVAAVYPGCAQQRTWCARAAESSYGDSTRFRSALQAAVSSDWDRMVEAARTSVRRRGLPGLAAPSAAEVADSLMRDWLAGSVCCPVALQAPETSIADDYAGYCRRSIDGSPLGAADARSCLNAVRAAQPSD